MKRAAILAALALSAVCAWKFHPSPNPAHASPIAKAIAPLSQPPKGSLVAHVRPFTVPTRAHASAKVAAASAAARLTPPAPARVAAIKANLLAMPLHFEENRGQAPAQYDYLSRGHGCSVFLRSNEARIVVADKNGTASAGLKLEAASGQSKAVALEPLAAKMNYYRGKDPQKWQTGIPTNARIKYEGIYPGIDVVYYGNQQKLEYDFVVAPHADPNSICWNADGADSVKLDGEGSLVLGIGGHQLTIKKPVAYQMENGARKIVEAGFRVENNRIRFALNQYDSAKTLVIDPIVQFLYSTYLGGTTGDAVDAVTVDKQGRIYVAGWSLGTGAFPVSGNTPPTGTFPVGTTPGYAGVVQPTHAADSNKDAFVAILDPTESTILYATYLGGGQSDVATAIALDPAGYIYVAGNTASTDFPTLNPAQSANAGGIDGFVTKLSNNGQLIYSTYVGSGADDTVTGIGVNSAGAVRLVGNTGSAFFYGHTPLQPGTVQGTFTFTVTDPTSSQTTAPIYEEEPLAEEAAIAGALNALTNVQEEGVFSAYALPKNPTTNAPQRFYDLTLTLNSANTHVNSITGGTTLGVFPSVTLVADIGSNSSYFAIPNTSGSADRYSPINGQLIQINNTSYPVIGGTAVTLAGDLNFTNTDGGVAKIFAGTYSVAGASGTAIKIKEWDTYTVDEDSSTVSIGGANYSLVLNPDPMVTVSGTLAYNGVNYLVNRTQDGPLVFDHVIIPVVNSWTIYNQYITIAGHNWPVTQNIALVSGQAYVSYLADIRLGSGLSDAFALSLTGTSHPTINTAGTYIIGGPGDDIINGVATNLNGVFYFAGQTEDPTKQGTVSGKFYYPMLGQVTDNDIYVIKMANEGEANAVAVDLNGFSYFAGTTPASDFPVYNAFETYPQTLDRSAPNDPMGSGYNGFVMKMDQGFAYTVFSTYLGGSKHDYVRGLAVDFRGYVYVTGETESIDFPTLGNATDQSSDRNAGNAFLSVLVPAGNELRYSTYFGGAQTDWGFGVAVSPTRNPIAYVVGYTDSDDFPTTPNTVYPTSRQPDTYTSGFVTAFQDQSVDLELESITTDLPVPIAGQQLTYTVTVKNLSTTVDCQDARVSQLLSSNLTFVSAQGANILNFTGGSLDTTTNTVSVDLGPVLAGREVSYTVTVLVTASEVISTTATVQAEYDNNSTNNSITLQQIARPLVSLSVPQPNASEDGTPGVFTVSRLGDLSPALTIKYTIGGNSTGGVNYQTLAGTVVLPAGSASANIVVAPYANTTAPIPGNSKTVIVTVQKGVNYETGTILSGTVTIANVPADVVNLSVPDSLGSKNSGDPVTFVVSRTGVLGQPLTVTYNLFGSATNGLDYQITGDNNTLVTGTTGIVTIPANTTSANITAVPIPDSLSGQPVATTSVGLQIATIAQTGTAPGTAYTLGPVSSGTGTILDVNPDSVSVIATLPNASASGTVGKFTITRSGDDSNLTNALSVQYTMGGTAISGSDYSALSGIATIPAGSTSVDVMVNPILTITSTTNKTAILTLSPPVNLKAYTLGASTQDTVIISLYAGTIVTVAAPVQIPATATATGTTTGSYVIARTGSTNLPLTVNYSMSGSAYSGVDYSPVGTSGTIPAGAGNMTVIVTPIDNGLTSGSETAILSVMPSQVSPVDYMPGTPGRAAVTINNASGFVRPVVNLSVVTNDASLTSGSGVLVFRVIRPDNNLSKAISVNYTLGGSAINGTDYQQLTGAIALPANVSTADIVVTPIWSNTVQPIKVVSITLAAGNDYDLGQVIYGTGSIDFPSNPTVTLSVLSGSASDVSGALNFAVTRAGSLAQAISVNYTTGGSAVNGVDYQPLTGSVALAAGSGSANIIVVPIWTAGVKQAQVMTVQLATGSGYALGANTFGSGAIGYVPWDVANVSVISGTAPIPESSGSSAVFQVSRTGDTTLPITVNYTMGGTAVSGVNYQPVSGSVVILASATSANVTIPILNAQSATPVNTLTLNLAPGTGYTTGAAASGLATISSAEPLITLALTGTGTVTQTSGTLVFQVTRTGDTTKAIAVNYTLAGTAGNGTDYQSLPGTIAFPSGAATENILVVPIWTTSTVAKTVSVQLGAGSNYVLGATTSNAGTITPVPWDTVTVANAPAAVSETGTNGNLSFVVTRTGDTAQPVTVNYTTAGTAISGVNYQPVTGTVVLPATSGTATIQIAPLNANSTVPFNTVLVNLGAGSGYNVGAVTVGSGTITSANPIVSVTLNGTNSVTQTSGTLDFRVNRGGDLSAPLLVNYTLGGSAVNGADYQALTGSALFLAGASTADVLVCPIWTGGASKVVTLKLATGAGYALSTSNTFATATITQVQWGPVSVSLSPASVSETGSNGNLVFTVTRSGDLAQPVTVNYTMGGTAVSGVNYQSVPASVVIPSGTNAATIPVVPMNVGSTVPSMTVSLTIGAGSGYSVGGVSSLTGTIVSANPVVSLAVNGAATVTQTSGTLDFCVTRGGDLSKAVAVNYTMGGSAINGADYQNLPGSLAFAAGSATADILAAPIWTGGPDKVVSVQLGAGSGYVLGSGSTSASGAITKVALDGVSLSVLTGSVSETGSNGNLSFLVTRSGDFNQPLTFNYTLGGSAVSGVNYQPVTGSVAIPAGTGTGAISVTPINAGMTIPANTVIVNAASGNGYTAAGIAAVTGTITSASPVVSVAVNGASTVTQTSGTLDFRVTRGGDLSKAVAVNYTLAGTAANGVDYQSLPGTLAFASGSATAEILVSPIWTGSPDKVVSVQLTAGTGYVLGGSNTSASGDITRVSWNGISFSVLNGSVSETGSNGNLSFLVTRSGDFNQALTFNYTLGGSAVSGVNYQPVTGSVAIPAGSGTAAVSVAPINASSTVPSNTVILNAASGNGYVSAGVATVTGAIVSANPVMSVAVNGTNAITQTTGPLVFRVTRGGDLTKVLAVNYTMGGTALSGSDYQALPGAVAFLANASTADIPVYPIWNSGSVTTKVVSVQLGAGAGYVLSSSNSASGTIAPVAWDGVNVSVAPGTVSETGSNGNLNFVVSRTGDTNQSITVNYTMGGTAVSGSNYVAVSGSATIFAGGTSTTVPVIPINTSSNNPFKTVTMTVAAGTDYTLGAVPMASGTILSANPVVSVNLSGTSAVTQTSGTLDFRVSRGGDISKAIAVTYTLGGSAVAGADYQNIGGTVAFAANSATADVLISPIWTGASVDKVVSIQLATGTGYVVDNTAMTVAGTIRSAAFDSVNVALSPATIIESNTNGSLGFQVTRTGDLNQPITVNYTMGGTAVSGVNYQPVTGAVTIASGIGSATVPVSPLDAHSTTPFKTVSLALGSGSFYNVGTVPSVTGTISSESPVVSLSVLNSLASQSGSGSIVLQVSRTGDTSKAISVTYTLGGSAVSGDDFQAIPTSIALAANTSSTNIVITPIWGVTYKAPKVVTVQLTAGTGYVLGDSSLGSGTINFPNFPEVDLTVVSNDASQTSGPGVLSFQVTRTGDLSKAITVTYTTAGTAVSGADFIALPGSISMGVGVSSATVVVTPNWSGNPRPVKVFSLQLTTGNNYVLGSSTTGSGTIDFIDSPQVTVAVLNSDAMPPGATGTGAVLFTVSRTGDISKAITVNFTMGGSAVSGQDYYPVTAIVLSASVSSGIVQVVPYWNNTAKTGPDSVTIQLNDGTGYKLGSTTYASGSIDWPNTPVVSLSTVNNIASLSGSNAITFKVSRVGDLSQPIQVGYILGGNAVYGDDYQAYTGTMDPSHNVVLPAGTGTAYVTIVPNWSSLVKPIKLVTIQLNGATTGAGGYLLSPYTFGQGTINFPGAPEVDLTVTSPVALQGSGSGAVIFHVTRTDASQAISVNYSVGGSAVNGVDYQTLPLSVALPVGVLAADITVLPQWANGVNGANGNNAVKIVTAQLISGVGYVLGANTFGSGALDFPQYPEVNLNVISGACTQVSGSLVFQVTRTGTLSNPITVSYTLGGSALNGVDYQSLPGTVTLSASAASALIVVNPIWSGYLFHSVGGGSVTVQLGANTGYVLGSNTYGSGEIVPVPWDVVSVSVPQPIASETGTNAIFHIARVGDTTLAITVNYVMGGSAVNGLNYQTLSGQVAIASGSTGADVVLTPINVGSETPSNTAILTVVSGSGYVTGTNATAYDYLYYGSVYSDFYVNASGTATIMSANPLGTVSLTTVSNDASQTSGSGLLIFHVSRTGTTSQPIQIPFALGGDAVSGVDYQPVTGSIDKATSIVLPAGVSGTDIVITPIWTDQVKPVKLVAVQLLSGTGYLLGANSFGQGTIDFPNYPEVDLTVLSNNASPTSGTSAVIFQVTRTGDTSKPIAVNYTPGGTAVAGDDYQVLPGTLTLPAGVSSGTIVVTPNWLNTVKPVKLISVQIASGNGYVLGSNIYGAGTINFPNDPVVSLNVLSAVASQTGTSYLAFQITRTGDTSKAIAVNYLTGGNAVAGSDYLALPGYVVLSPSVSSVGVVVLPTWNNSVQPSKLMSLEVSAGTGYVLGSNLYGAGTILLSSSANVSLSVTSNAATSGSGTLVFHVTRTGDLTQAISVGYTMGGSAVSGVDYQPVLGSVTLGVGTSSADVVVTPIWNATVRPDRVVTLQLAPGTGYGLVGNIVGVGTISDTAWDVVTLSVPQPGASESGTTAIFRVTRSGSSNLTRAITVNYTMGGTAVAGINYQPLSGSVTIPVGGTTADIVVTPMSDHVNTPDLTVVMSLASGQYYTAGSVATGTATIANVPDNSLVSLTTITSAATDTLGNLVFQVTRTGVVSQAILVNYTLGGSAVNGVDYQLLSGNVTLPAGVTTGTITVIPIWLSTVKLPQVVTVQLAAGVGYDLTGNTFGSGSLTYVPWDTVSLSAVLSGTVPETSGAMPVFRLTRTGDVTKPITVNYTTAGTAVSRVNYAPLSGSQVIAASSSTADIVVTPIDDHVNTPDNTLSLTLAGGSNYTLTGAVTGTTTIANVPDNQVAMVVGAQATESGHSGWFTITRTGPTDKSLDVFYYVNGTARGGSDYVALSGSVNFPVGSGTAYIVVKPLVNAANKTSPTVKVTLKPSLNYTTPILSLTYGIITIQNYAGTIVSVTPLVSAIRVTNGPGIYRILRVGSLTTALTVKYTLAGTAVNGVDYTGLSGVATIPAGINYVDVQLNPINRNQPTGWYAATMTLSAGSGYLVGPPSAATVNIRSNGPTPVSIAADPSATSNWEGYGSVGAIISRTGSTTDPLTVYYTTSGSAVAGVNYAPVSGMATIPSGASTVEVSFNTIDDGVITQDMSLIVGIKSAAGYTITSPSQATLTIKDADLHGVTF